MGSQDLIWLALPSRARPEAAWRAVNSALVTADRPELVRAGIRVDLDDKTLGDYRLLRPQAGHLILEERGTLGLAFDQAARAGLEEGASIVMMTGDDLRFRSFSWDTYLRRHFDRFEDRIAFVYGRDGLQDQTLGTHGAVSREWIEVVGCFTPHNLLGSFADVWLHNLATGIERAVYEPEIYTEHLHPDAGKARMDRTYRERPPRARARRRYYRLVEEGTYDEALARLQEAVA